MRLIQVPKLHKGAFRAVLPVRCIRSASPSANPGKMKMSIASSAMKEFGGSDVGTAEVAGHGAEVCMNMP